MMQQIRVKPHYTCNGLLLEFIADLNARNVKGKAAFELLPNSPSSKTTVQIIIKEGVKREALGQFLCER